MKIHVVCADHTTDRVLPRMARALAEQDGWTVGEKPDPHADLNYFLPYLEVPRGRPWTATKAAAYFTHREDNTKGKIWDQAAAAVDLRIVTAAQYREALAPLGPTVQAPPPVDLAHFTPGKRETNLVPVVGVSGWVYPGGRKGEALVKAAAEALGERIGWKAAGKGWPAPVPTRLYPWDKLPAFYRSLDVYFCAATVEGVPMPPLEAMACGTRCVLPRGVGLLDELPDLPDLYRYEAGNVADALDALRRATSDTRPVHRDALRAAVAGFTPDAWREAHARAIAQLLDPQPAAAQPDEYGYVAPDLSIRPPAGPWVLPTLPRGDAPGFVSLAQDVEGVGVQQRTDRGVYVVAYGAPARECARRLLSSLGRYMPDIPVVLVGDEPLGAGESRFMEAPRGDIGARSVKVQIYDLAPAEWDYVLYLDADTELVAPVPFLFDAVADGWDFAICKNPQRFHVAQHMVRPDNQDECRETFRLWGTDQIMQWNGGVFSFRRGESTRAFFSAWHQEWLRYGKRDQAALLRALWANPLRLLPLGNEWNLVPTYDSIDRSAGIVHHVTEAREWGKGIIPQRGDSPEAFAAMARASRQGRIVGSQSTRPVREIGGPLVKLEIKPGQFIRVTEREAERLRRVQEEKARQQAPNKQRVPAGVK